MCGRTDQPQRTRSVTKEFLRVSSCPLWFRALFFVALFFFRRQSQAEHGNPAFPGNIDFRVFRTGQIQRLAMLAAVHFSILSPSLRHVAARLFDRVGHVIPAFEMSAAEFAFGIQLIAGALSRFLDFDFVMGKLVGCNACGPAGFGCGQRSCPRRCGRKTAGCRLGTIHFTRKSL